MNIIIAGDGKVGFTLAQQLTAEGHDVTLLDSDRQVLNTCMERLDAMVNDFFEGITLKDLLEDTKKD